MISTRKHKIYTLLKGIETGDAAAAAVVNPDKYIQHNPQTEEGGEGLADLFKRLSQTSPRVNIVRLFEDGDYVFGHTEYDFSNQRVGFEVFRFEGDQAVEHWDNIQSRKGPNHAGHTMVDGPTEAIDLNRTESNRALVKSFIEEALISRHVDKLGTYVDSGYCEHNPKLDDGVETLRSIMSAVMPDGYFKLSYNKLHRILAEGNFVLSVSEGTASGIHTAFYDLFRIADNKVVEHWDTTEAIPPAASWKNQNGKF